MKKFLLLLAMPVFTVPAIAQIQITTSDLPDAGDILNQRNAIFLSDVDMNDTGADHTWTYDTDVLQSLDITSTTVCGDVDTLSFGYQIFFNSPFDSDHNSDYVTAMPDISFAGITLEDVYTFYQNRDDRYAITGSGALINSIPTGALGDPVDVIYNLPIDYGDEDSLYSELTWEVPTLGVYNIRQWRVNHCDGWGTLVLFGEEYDVLRVRTDIYATDSAYIDFIQTGFAFERPVATEYKWLAPGLKIPALQVNESGGFITSVLIPDFSADIVEAETAGLVFFPNPANEQLMCTGIEQPGARFILVSQSGQKVAEGNLWNQSINVSALSSGVYYLLVFTDQGVRTGSFVRE